MSDLSNFWWQAAGGPNPGLIGNALRFRGSQRLTRTPSATGNTQTTTISWWMKRTSTSNAANGVFNTGNNRVNYRLNAGTYGIDVSNVGNGGTNYFQSHAELRRDPSAWYHVVHRIDLTQATSTDRVRTYINGSLISQSGWNIPPQNNGTQMNTAGVLLELGTSETEFFNGYFAEFHWCDGQSLGPTTFGEFNADGVWIPKKVSGVTYGTNGFYLDFSDAANIGKDRSGRGNDFTATGFELTTTTSTNYDWVADSPTNNFATLTPLYPSGYRSVSDGNLTTTGTTSADSGLSISGAGLSSGKWVWEVTIGSRVSNDPSVGITAELPPNGNGESISSLTPGAFYRANGDLWLNASKVSTATALTAGDVLQYKLDLDAWTLAVALNNVDVYAFTLTPATYYPCAVVYNGGFVHVNYGQQPFHNAPPAGFQPLSTAELPAVAITKPSDHFTTILDTGANILTAAKAKFPNGLWWIKDRANAEGNKIVDSINGTSSALIQPNTSDTPYAVGAYTAPAGNSVAYCWGTPAGGINTTAGFSITSGTHGLTKAPEFVIDRGMNAWHKDLPAGQGLRLWIAAPAVAQTWTVNGTTVSGPGGGSYYSWHSVPGYSAFGSYEANNNVDGVFCYTGFRVGWLLVKRVGGTTMHGTILNSAVNTYNSTSNVLYTGTNTPEASGTYANVDFLSNGFKLRTTWDYLNDSGRYVWAAFAEHPFGGSNVSPSPAR